MSKISTYEVVPVPKLADKLIGTSVGGVIEDITYNFTLLELLNLFLPIIPANNLQGVLDYGNTATQDIVLYGTIYTTNLEVTNTATLLDSYLNGDTNVLGALYDVNGSKGLAAQVLTSTGNYVEWVTLPPIFTPNLQQVLTVGNTANLDIILTANIQALDINVNTATVNNNITIDGTITDGYSSVGTLNQVLSSTGTDIKWVNLPVYSATSPLFLDSITGIFSIQQSNGTQSGYLSAADWITFNGKQNAGNYITALTGEATATGPGSVAITLSNPAVTGKVLTGLSITGGSISAADSILSAFGKVQNQLNGLVGGVMFKGVWNAFTNTPTLTSSIGTQGWYYIVDVAGTTNLNGITDWQVGDWAIFNGSTWNKIDNTDLVTSVNGQVGAVSLTTDDISEGSLNLYFTDTRARNSVSATTPLAYNNISGVFSIQVATTSQDGYLTSTDWTTFNSKQNALSGTGLVKSTSGTITYITDNSSNWNTAYNDSIVSAAVTGTSTKTLTLNQQDGGTITASWSDIDTGLTSIGLSMPVAFSVANTPLISNGTLAVTAIGTATQYIRGDGQLATFPTAGGGGSSVFYYLNGSIAASVATYKQMSNTAIIGAGTDFNLSGNGLIAQFLTDAGNPNRLEIPGGAWNFEMFFSMSSSGGTPQFYVELLKYDGAVFTSIASGSAVPETISGGTLTDLYLSSLAVPTTTLLLTDRLAVRVYIVNNSGGRTATLHTEDGNLCQIITTFSSGISAINGLTSNNQYLAVGTAGIDFAINSLLETHTFNLPTASASNRGALSSADWTTFNDKLSTTTAASTYVPYTGATTNVDLGTNFLFSDYGKFYRGILMSQSGGGMSATGYTGISASGTNGVTFNTITQANILSFNSSALRTYTFPDDSGTVALVGGAGVGTVTSVAALTLGTTGTDLSSTVANSTTTPVITLNVPTASASNRGALSSTDWTTFNSKQNALTNPVTGSGGANFIPKFTSASIIANSQIYDNGTGVGVGITTLGAYFDVNGTGRFSGQLTLSSTLSNGTYIYTLPSATGTLALTSALSGYLPLTGGTLTGALNGTSAAFSTSVTINGAATSGKLNIQTANDNGLYIYNGSSASRFMLNNYFGFGIDALFLQEWNTSNVFQRNVMTFYTGGNVGVGTGGTDAGYKLDVNGTGRFSGVTTFTKSSNGTIGLVGNMSQEVGTSADGAGKFSGFGFGYNGGSYYPAYMAYYVSSGGGNTQGELRFAVRNSGSDIAATSALTIASTGAASFSSSVTTVNEYYVNNVGQNAFKINSSGSYYGMIQNTAADKWSLAYGATGPGNTTLGTSVLTWTGAGNVGIGTTSPSSYADKTLQLHNSSTGSTYFKISNITSGSAIGDGLDIGEINSDAYFFNRENGFMAFGTVGIEKLRITSAGKIYNSNAPSGDWGLELFSNTTTSAAYGLHIRGGTNSSDAALFIEDAGGTTAFFRVTGAGNVLIGTTTSSSGVFKLEVGNGTSDTRIYCNSSDVFALAVARSSNSIFYLGADTSGNGIFSNGSGTAISNINRTTGTYTATSDINKKKDFELPKIGLNEILQLRSTLYRMKEDKEDSFKYLGFIAQEVKEFIPQAFVQKDDFIGLDYQAITSALVKAVQEQQEQIKELQSQINK